MKPCGGYVKGESARVFLHCSFFFAFPLRARSLGLFCFLLPPHIPIHINPSSLRAAFVAAKTKGQPSDNKKRQGPEAKKSRATKKQTWQRITSRIIHPTPQEKREERKAGTDHVREDPAERKNVGRVYTVYFLLLLGVVEPLFFLLVIFTCTSKDNYVDAKRKRERERKKSN